MVVFPTVDYIALATRSAVNSDYSAPWSSSLAALHGQAGNLTAPGRVPGPTAEGGRQSSTPGRRLADVTGIAGEGKCMEVQKKAL